ncbi:phage baseplate protein [Riemerella anatipestifer]|uniref:phage baseplate protein n=1 Tax=Riemerella anatipestifer TaxID=34085 RepID=UPI0013724B33|nr:hypothetical protein [Riemerella anatipestifer]MBT0550257.1 hypothetical protein [Riemerella anatipestifer]MBT0556981.1 hypothetical protein [Riemerella anatipestifer]MBT0561017.1 hypothetical protein [Riemerella anatipestifer]NAV17312.1 hypothetical protein [Riemerella anatipestifer]
MNKLNFNQTGGFPLSTNILDAMQMAYSIFNKLGGLAGNLAIISGCEVSGNSVTDGVVYINGELLDFKGGTLAKNVIIREETESRIFEDGGNKPVIFKRYATFGSSTPDQTYSWADFKRVFPTTEIASFKKSLEDRIKALENKKSPIPIGLIAIWGKPASEPIPEGWREYGPLRGRMPVGWDPNDFDFNTVEATGGEKQHTLTIAEMPRHSHNQYWTIGVRGASGSGGTLVDGHRQTTETGGNQPHNNMPPYRVIRFIEFVGF